MNKPFFLFAGYDYYPSGGMEDFKGAFATEDEAEKSFETQNAQRSIHSKWEWHHITNVLEYVNSKQKEPEDGEEL